MGGSDPNGRAIFDLRDMIGRSYVVYHQLLLHAKYTSSSFCGFREEDCFHYKPMADIDPPPPRHVQFKSLGHGWQDL